MDEDVLELPGISHIEVGVDEIISAIHQRIPISVVPFNWANVVMLDLKASLEVHLIRFN